MDFYTESNTRFFRLLEDVAYKYLQTSIDIEQAADEFRKAKYAKRFVLRFENDMHGILVRLGLTPGSAVVGEDKSDVGVIVGQSLLSLTKAAKDYSQLVDVYDVEGMRKNPENVGQQSQFPEAFQTSEIPRVKVPEKFYNKPGAVKTDVTAYLGSQSRAGTGVAGQYYVA